MNQRTNRKLLVFIRILLFHVILFNSGCSKYTKTPDPGKTNPASSKIIYTDVTPDSVIAGSNSTNHYGLDFNNDGIIDFTFSVYIGASGSCGGAGGFLVSYIEVNPAGVGNAIAESNSFPSILDSLSTIGDSLSSWSASNNQILTYSFFNPGSGDIDGGGFRCSSYRKGEWAGQSKYAGFKFEIAGHSYFGWARLKVNGIGIPSLTVMSYAYNSIPNQPILAGQTK
jgi:hypothetical protein